MVREKLDKNLNEFVDVSNLDTAVFDLIITVESEGWVDELVRVAHDRILLLDELFKSLSKVAKSKEDIAKEEAALRPYLAWVETQYDTMQIFGMARPVSLSAIYTDVFVLDRPTALCRFSLEALQESYREAGRERALCHGERQSGLSLVQRESRLFILGKPGAGKTTFLKRLVV